MKKIFSFLSKLAVIFVAITSIIVGVNHFFQKKKQRINELLKKKKSGSNEVE